MAVILAIGGVNGAGKSSVVGEVLRDFGKSYYNPDEVARRLRTEKGMSENDANGAAWQKGKDLLEEAIRNRADFAFESTLGANTIPRLLREAAEAGIEVKIWFVGLSSPEQHLARVRARVEAGGHDIPEEKIRERWEASRRNIINLLPYLTELRVFDNSAERDPVTGAIPAPKELLHWQRGKITAPAPTDLASTAEWARPIVARALELNAG